MSFTVSSTELLKRASVVSSVVPTRSVLPIIQNLHLQLLEDKLQLTGTDLEMTMRNVLDVTVEGEEPFNVAVPAKLLTDILKALPEQPVTFELNTETFAVTLKVTNGEYHINALDGNDFPRMPLADDTTEVNLDVKTFRRVVNGTIFAASTDDLKVAMNGIFFDLRPEHATFVATDAHRLVRFRRKDITVEQPVSFIVMVKALKALMSSLENAKEGQIKLAYNSTHVFFTYGPTLLAGRIIDARFPDYENVIPSSSDNKLRVDTKELLGTMKRLDILSNKTTHLGKFNIGGNVLRIESQDTEYANRAEETLSCLYEGEEMDIGFNLSQMIEVISNLGTDETVLELGSSNRAAIVLPDEQHEESEELLMLLMPIMLNVAYS